MEAALTPDTLARIRTQANSLQAADIAKALGWPLDKLRRVARERQIELLNPVPMVMAPAPPMSSAPPELGEATPRPIAADFRSRQGKIDLGPDATIEGILSALRGSQRMIFHVLVDHMDKGPLSGLEISDKLPDGMSRAGISLAIGRMSFHLRGTKFRIRSISGGGIADRGYRLMAVKP